MGGVLDPGLKPIEPHDWVLEPDPKAQAPCLPTALGHAGLAPSQQGKPLPTLWVCRGCKAPHVPSTWPDQSAIRLCGGQMSSSCKARRIESFGIP